MREGLRGMVPPFELEADWELMAKTNGTEVRSAGTSTSTSTSTVPWPIGRLR